MSCKHYREVAEIIKEEWEFSATLPQGESLPFRVALVRLAGGMADMFQADNDRFDRQKFLHACQPE